MDYQREAREQYYKAYSIASRNQLKDKKQRVPANPTDLDTLLNEAMISEKVDLGVMDIPVNLIVGAAENKEALHSFTRDFLPLEKPGSEFAAMWRKVYEKYVSVQNSCQVSCLEYLGKFYVVEGILVVSVAKIYGSNILRSNVIRIMPKYTECKAIARYYDFLNQFEMTNLYQLQFTQSGYLEKLQFAMDKDILSQWSDNDRSGFMKYWPKIERAFQTSFNGCLSITSADAFVVLLEKYSISQIIQMDSWVLARLFQASWRDLSRLSCANREEADSDLGTLFSA